MQSSAKVIGISLKLLNLFVFTIISLLFGYLQANILHVIFLINVSSVIFMLPWIFATRGKHLKIHNRQQYINYIFRALFNFLGIFTWVRALKMMVRN